MARRKEDDVKPGSPAWMTTFGDLMNLLLCFFVLLFSMSTVDANKFELIAASFSKTFSILPAGAMAVGDGMLVSNGVSQLNELSEYINSMGMQESIETETELEKFEQEQLKESEQLAEKIEEALREASVADEVDVDFTAQYVSLTLNGAILFDSGKDQLKEEILPLMSKIGQILQRYAESDIEIEGHTDNVPIHNARFSNNDELSSFRALSVFQYFVENTTLNPANIRHTGRGEYIPIADNSSPEGRAKNRRVEIRVYHTLSAY